MANSNTVAGFYNLPAKVISVAGTAFQVITSPAAAGTYPGLPSPAFPAGSALSVGLADLAIGSRAYDNQAFKLSIHGLVLGITNSTFTLTLNQVAAAQKGKIGAAAPVTSTGVQGTGLTAVATLLSTETVGALYLDVHSDVYFLWSSSCPRLVGYSFTIVALSNGNVPATPVYIKTTGITVANLEDINFILSASINTAADATTYFKLNEFSISRI